MRAVIRIRYRNGIVSGNQIARGGGCLCRCRIPAISIRCSSTAGRYRRCSGVAAVAKNIGFRSSCCQRSGLRNSYTCCFGASLRIRNRNGVISGNQITCRSGCLRRCGIPAIGVRCSSAACRYRCRSIATAITTNIGFRSGRGQCCGLRNSYTCCFGASLRIRNRNGVISGNQITRSSRCLRRCGIPTIGIRCCSAGCRYRRCSGVSTITKHIGFRSGCSQCSRLRNGYVCRLDAIIGIRNRNGVISENQIACRGGSLRRCRIPAIGIRCCSAGCRYRRCSGISTITKHICFDSSCSQYSRLSDNDACCLNTIIGIGNRNGIISGNQIACRDCCLGGCRIPAIGVRCCSTACRYRRCSGIATIAKNIGFRSSCCQCCGLSDNDACRLNTIIGIGNRNGVISGNQIARRGGCLRGCRVPAIRIRGRSAGSGRRRRAIASTITGNIGIGNGNYQRSRLQNRYRCGRNTAIAVC